MIRVIVILALAVMLSGCKKDEAATPVPPAPAPDAAPVTDLDLGKRYAHCWDAWNERKWDAFDACYAPSAAALAEGSKMLPLAFPDIAADLGFVMVAGNTVIGVVHLRGTHTASLPGPDGPVPPTGKKIGLPYAHIVELDDQGRITKEWLFMDSASFGGQLGLHANPHRAASDTPWIDADATAVRKGSEEESSNVAAYQTMAAAFNAHDGAAFAASLADGVSWSEWPLQKDLSKAETLTMMQQMWGGFSDLKITPHQTWAAASYVAAIGTLEGTNDGALASLGIKRKTGKKVAVPFMEIIEFDDGKAVRAHVLYDAAGFAQQLR